MRCPPWIYAAIFTVSFGYRAVAHELKVTPRAPAQFENYNQPPVLTPAAIAISIQGYYDPLTSYNNLATNSVVQYFGHTNTNGLAGLVVMATYQFPSRLEIGAGFDYMFPVSQQGQQVYTGSYAVNSQTLNLMGIKVVQVGYKIPFGKFAIVPYGGMGIYYGKDVVALDVNVNSVDTVTYSKLMALLNAGVRGEYSFNRTFSLNVGIEGFLPSNIETQLSQSGNAVNGELPGDESYLQQGMDFMTGFGLRLYGGAKLSF